MNVAKRLHQAHWTDMQQAVSRAEVALEKAQRLAEAAAKSDDATLAWQARVWLERFAAPDARGGAG